MTASFDRTRLRDVHLVPLTAYDSAARLDLDRQAAHLGQMSRAGIRVFLPAAGTSEFHSLSADDIVAVVKTTREATGPHATIFAPIGLQLSHSLDVGARCLEAGADGLMFMPFVHPYLSDRGIADYYRAVMDELGCPVMMYKKDTLPSDALLLEFAADPLVVGIKYAVNNMHQFRQTVLKDKGNTEWLCGSAERFAPYYMLAGAPGYTTGAGNLCPRLTLAMFQAFSTGQYSEGMRLQELILPIENFRARDGDSFNISMLKHGLKLKGLDFGPPRPPGRTLTSQEEREIAEMLEPIFEAETRLSSEMLIAGL